MIIIIQILTIIVTNMMILVALLFAGDREAGRPGEDDHGWSSTHTITPGSSVLLNIHKYSRVIINIIRFSSGNSSVRFGSVRKIHFPVRRGSGLRFSDASWLGLVRFGSFPRPVPVGSRFKRFGSVRFGRFGSVSYSFLSGEKDTIPWIKTAKAGAFFRNVVIISLSLSKINKQINK